MKYAVFVSSEYYPKCGLEDLWKTFESVEDVKKALREKADDFVGQHPHSFIGEIQIVDLDTLKIVSQIYPGYLERRSREKYGTRVQTKRIPDGMLMFNGEEVGKLENGKLVRLKDTYEHESLIVSRKAMYLEIVEGITV